MKTLNTSYFKSALLVLGLVGTGQLAEAQRIDTDKILKNYSVTVHGGITSAYADVRTYDFARVTKP
jgi:hypothetical protein